jgi:hypothetical protein
MDAGEVGVAIAELLGLSLRIAAGYNSGRIRQELRRYFKTVID